MRHYRLMADQMERDIRSGRLRPGERLPPQREFAFAHGVATSTASRIYRELIERGLAVGEVGRGTFVVEPRPAVLNVPLTEPTPAGGVDLEMNYPSPGDAAQTLAPALEPLLRVDRLNAALAPTQATGSARLRELASALLAGPGWSPGAGGIVFTAGGRQAIAAAISAQVAPGEVLAVEALTYPVVKGLATRLGVRLAPVAMDSEGLLPEALAQAAQQGARAVYLQPSLHNPLGVTMGPERRTAIAGVLRAHEMVAIEDAVYRFLAPEDPPLAGFAPERVILVDSLSKRLSPGLTLGFMAVAPDRVDACAAAVRQGGWGAAGFAMAAGEQLLTQGALEPAMREKRTDAAQRQTLAREILSRWLIRSDPRAYHIWLALPESWRAETFLMAAAQKGIRIVPGAAFTVGRGHAPNAVRLALASPSLAQLQSALHTLDQLLSAPDTALVDE